MEIIITEAEEEVMVRIISNLKLGDMTTKPVVIPLLGPTENVVLSLFTRVPGDYSTKDLMYEGPSPS